MSCRLYTCRGGKCIIKYDCLMHTVRGNPYPLDLELYEFRVDSIWCPFYIAKEVTKDDGWKEER